MSPLKILSGFVNMRNVLTQLVRISRIVGADVDLVLGGFGNTSVKTADGKFMYIKASGTAIKDMTRTKGWRRLRLSSVRAVLEDKSIVKAGPVKRQGIMTKALLAACDDRFCAAGNRSRAAIKPSVESCFHSLLGRFVIHLHPAAVLAYACAKNGRQRLQGLFSREKLPPLWVPYADPGYMLAKRIQRLVGDYKARYGRSPDVLFLQNHGLVVSADNPSVALRLVRKVVNTCRSRLKAPKAVRLKCPDAALICATGAMIRRTLFNVTGKRTTVCYFAGGNAAVFLAGKDAAKLCSGPAITPDELVYAHGPVMWLDKSDRQRLLGKLNRRIANRRQGPAGFLIKPLGLFIAAEKKNTQLVADVVGTYLLVRLFAAGLGGVHCLNRRQRDFILASYGFSIVN